MATGGRTTNTMSEMLVNMLRDISVAKTLPDADLEFLVNVETSILAKLRAPLEAAAGQMPPGSVSPDTPPQSPFAPPPGMGPMMPEAPVMGSPIPPPMGQPPVGAGVPGLRAQPPGPSPDELARIMGNVGA